MIRSFHSITVLRKRSERRVFRRGSPGASLPSFAALRKKVAPAGAKQPSSKPPSRRSGQLPLGEAVTAVTDEGPPPQRAILRASADSPFASAVRNSCPVASGGPLSLPPKKEAKETA